MLFPFEYAKNMLRRRGQEGVRDRGSLVQALSELPADIVIPSPLSVSRTSGERVLERIEEPQRPTKAMRELLKGD